MAVEFFEPGDRVAILDHPGLPYNWIAGSRGTVVRLIDPERKYTSLVVVERDGDPMFKWPRLYPWMITHIKQEEKAE